MVWILIWYIDNYVQSCLLDTICFKEENLFLNWLFSLRRTLSGGQKLLKSEFFDELTFCECLFEKYFHWFVINWIKSTFWISGYANLFLLWISGYANLILHWISGYAKPFTIHVHTNAIEGTQSVVESKNRGFCLNYVQQPCTTSTSG